LQEKRCRSLKKDLVYLAVAKKIGSSAAQLDRARYCDAQFKVDGWRSLGWQKR